MTSEEIISRLKNYSLFEDIADDDDKMKQIASILEERHIKAGEFIFKQNDHGEELFILLTGAVRVCKNTRQNEEYTIVDLRAEYNVFFGEIALMDSDKRSASIRVLEDCDVLVMSQESFMELGNKHPEISLPITRIIGKKICSNLRNVNNDVILLFDALVDEIQSTQL